ncbi:MAG: hypothetical protein LBS20_11815 [Prevotella sp.]|nr:hypothetical protein [Prevotella sp.]
MKKIINRLKSFRGISFCPFSLNLNTFNGFSITILKFGWDHMDKVCLIGNTWSLFHIGFHDSIDDSFIFCINIFGCRWKVFLKPRIVHVCPNCKSKMNQSTPIDGEVLCDECSAWIPLEEIIVTKLYKE